MSSWYGQRQVPTMSIIDIGGAEGVDGADGVRAFGPEEGRHGLGHGAGRHSDRFELDREAL